MRILIVSQYYYPERNSVNDVAEGLVKLGHHVTIVTAKPNYGFGRILKEYKKVSFENINGVQIHRLNLYPRKNNRLSIYLNYMSFHNNAKRFVRHFKQEFDVVLSFSLSPVISVSPAILFAKKHHIPHLLFCQDLWPESTVVTKAVRKDSFIYKLLYRWSCSIYSKCDRIIISSPSFKDYFENVLHISDKGFDYINQPILASKNKDIDPVIYVNKYNIVYAGNIGKLQLTASLVEAMQKLTDKNIKLHLMGMGSELPLIKEMIEDNHMENMVEYHGALPIEEAERYYLNADALIVSLKNEGFVGKTIPNKAIQYLKYAKPIIGVVSGDSKELLQKANGTIFSSEDIVDIATTIENVCHLSDEEKTKLGQNNKGYFDGNLSSEKLVEQIESTLKDLIK